MWIYGRKPLNVSCHLTIFVGLGLAQLEIPRPKRHVTKWKVAPQVKYLSCQIW